MICQIPFSGKNKKNLFSFSSAESAHSMASENYLFSFLFVVRIFVLIIEVPAKTITDGCLKFLFFIFRE